MQLLLGEPPSSSEVDDVVHWCDVYAELTDFLELACAGCRPDADHAGRMKEALAAMARRRSFWCRQDDELSAPPSAGTAN